MTLSWVSLAGYAMGVASVVLAALYLDGAAQATVSSAGAFLIGLVTRQPGAAK